MNGDFELGNQSVKSRGSHGRHQFLSAINLTFPVMELCAKEVKLSLAIDFSGLVSVEI